MNALHNYLNGNRSSNSRQRKAYEQLSLPKIPQKPSQSTPKTSINHRTYKKKHKQSKYSSETTLSPEQQHVHDQVKITLGGYGDSINYGHVNRDKLNLPKIYQQKKQNNHYIMNLRKSKSTNNQKVSLTQILNDPYAFAQNYFAQIHQRSK